MTALHGGLVVLGVLAAVRLRDPAGIGGATDAALLVAIAAFVVWLESLRRDRESTS